jgi:hypothetical protein
MPPPNCLYLIALVLAVAGWGTAFAAEGDVTVIAAPTAAAAPSQKTVASDGTPVVHKSLHKKKQAATATTSTPPATGAQASPAPPAADASAVSTENKMAMMAVVTTIHTSAATTTSGIAPTNTTSYQTTPVSNASSGGLTPAVETGLPVAKYPGMGTPIKGVSTYIPSTVTLSPGQSVAGTTMRPPLYASVLPSSVVPLTSTATGIYSSPSRTVMPSTSFPFVNYSRRIKNTYPWKTNIITTMFWIGEGSTPISSTTNVQSSWDQDWLPDNHGSDSPYNRNGYAAGNHASTLNPFYVALPFNDLAFPDKAHEYLPPGWYRPPRDGKQVSACKDRWVEIKNAQGRTCYAQWEDVGPLRYDHAEYVFGSERPIGIGDDHAGLDVSPAVAQYLGIDGKNRITSWRFVDDEDVRPGYWLQLDEQAVLFSALHQMKNTSLPIHRATEPIEDPQNADSNKKKVDASKG